MTAIEAKILVTFSEKEYGAGSGKVLKLEEFEFEPRRQPRRLAWS
jgi:hypothetical protein